MRLQTKKACSFFGHGSLNDKDGRIYCLLVKEIETLIENGYGEFLFGGYGDFDSLSRKAADSLKEKYPHIKTVYVQAYYKPKDGSMEIIRGLYDDTLYPAIERKPKKFAVIYRNQEMINISDFCIFYVERSYGGALRALRYAKRKNKARINLAERINP